MATEWLKAWRTSAGLPRAPTGPGPDVGGASATPSATRASAAASAEAAAAESLVAPRGVARGNWCLAAQARAGPARLSQPLSAG